MIVIELEMFPTSWCSEVLSPGDALFCTVLVSSGGGAQLEETGGSLAFPLPLSLHILDHHVNSPVLPRVPTTMVRCPSAGDQTNRC